MPKKRYTPYMFDSKWEKRVQKASDYVFYAMLLSGFCGICFAMYGQYQTNKSHIKLIQKEEKLIYKKYNLDMSDQ